MERSDRMCSTGEGNGKPFQYSCLENHMNSMAENEEEIQSLLMKVKEESEKFGLKLNIQKSKIMASGPITSWQIDGETLRDELPRSIGAQYAIGEEWRNSPRRNEEAEPEWKQHPVGDVSGGESKV